MSMVYDVTSIGESMLRLSVPAGERLERARGLSVHPAGAEANVLFLLARLGFACSWLSALPDNALGRLVANETSAGGLDISHVIWREEGRVGTFFVEFAAPPRRTQVIYDRADSCFARLRPEEVDWEALLDTRLLHLTGITPALSDGCLAVAKEAKRRARARGIPISFDVNYRARLWSEEDAGRVLGELAEGVEILFCAQADARRVFGIEDDPETTVGALAARAGAVHVVLSLGEQGVIGWWNGRVLRQPAFETRILDRLGAGDALAAGLLAGWLEGDFEKGLRYGAMLSALALSQHGDLVITDRDELAALLSGSAAGVAR